MLELLAQTLICICGAHKTPKTKLTHQEIHSILIGVHQIQMSLLVLDISQVRSTILGIKFFLKLINLSFAWDKCCHLTFSLNLTELNS